MNWRKYPSVTPGGKKFFWYAKDDYIPEGESNPHNVHPILFHKLSNPPFSFAALYAAHMGTS